MDKYSLRADPGSEWCTGIPYLPAHLDHYLSTHWNIDSLMHCGYCPFSASLELATMMDGSVQVHEMYNGHLSIHATSVRVISHDIRWHQVFFMPIISFAKMVKSKAGALCAQWPYCRCCQLYSRSLSLWHKTSYSMRLIYLGTIRYTRECHILDWISWLALWNQF